MADALCYPTDFLVNMAASADVLAQAKVEIALGSIPEGKNVCSGLPSFHCASTISDQNFLKIGHHQVAWQARLHPSPHPGGDQGGREH